MNFDMTFFNGLVIPIVVAASLILGYVLKHWIDDVKNRYIPPVLVIFGAVLACLVNKEISVEIVTAGAFSALASTGLHQVFKQLIYGSEKE